MKTALHEGSAVRVRPNVTTTAWGPPCNWGGKAGVITGGGGKVSGQRIWRVALDPKDPGPFGGQDFTEGQLEPIEAQQQLPLKP